MKNLLGIYEKALPMNITWKRRLEIASKLGFDFIEISIDENDFRLERLYWSDNQIYELRRYMEETGIFINSMCFSGHRRYPLGSRDPKVREKSLELMERAIEFAHKLGIRVIQLAGYDVYYEVQGEDTHQMYIENLRKCVKMAECKQVMLAIETMDTQYMSSMTSFLKVDKIIQSPWLTVYPDIGNLSAWGLNVEEEIEKGFHKIVAIHLKDTLAIAKDFEGKFKNVPFGQGCTDFAKILKKLKSLEYNGPFLIELWNVESSMETMAAVEEAKVYVLDMLSLGGF